MIGAAVVFISALYWAALPRPLRGIPYNKPSSRRLLGDIPAMVAHSSTEDGTLITYVIELMETLDSPIIQVFIRPFGKPMVFLADFQESQELLTHRKEFDRSTAMGDLLKGITPQHHIRQKTNNVWRNHRRLVQDLMTPSFLHRIAGPALHSRVSMLINLWRIKARHARSRAWAAADDINNMALDAIVAFVFGEKFEISATSTALDAVKAVGEQQEDHVLFPSGQKHEFLQAIRDLSKSVGDVQSKPSTHLAWAYVQQTPRYKKAWNIKEMWLRRQLEAGLARLMGQDNKDPMSAVDQLLAREQGLAQKDGRSPEYFSRVLIDELFGILFAGHETTSTALCWGVKFLADNPGAQSELREALVYAHSTAKREGRSPTVDEITAAQIPFLDATMEEMLRCAGTVPYVDREATRDTQLLGHFIPKGTVVACLSTGASMLRPAFNIDEAKQSQDGRLKSWDSSDMASFKPQRWLNDKSFDRAAGPQLAFGLGTRACYGRRLAYLEMQILLTLLLWSFELLACPPQLSDYKAELTATTEPRNCFVRLRELSPAT